MPDQDEEDVVHYASSVPAANPYTQVAPPSNIVPSQAAPAVAAPGQVPMSSDAVIGQATAQLNAGQPVTALPHQSWSLAEAQAFNARLDAFDQQARAARAARDASARDAQMLDQMMRVAKSTKDVEVAMQQQDVIGFRNAVASGAPALEALQRFPRAATSPLVAAIHAAQPVAAPHIVTDQGEKAWVSGAGHVTRIPGAEADMPVSPPQDIGGGVKVVRVSPKKLQVLEKGAGATAAQEISALRARASLKEQQFIVASPKKGSPEEKKFLDDLAAIDKRLEELSAGGTTVAPAPAPQVAAPAAPIRSAVRNPKTGKWELK